MGQPSISVTKVLADLGVAQARCGCKPGRESDGWREVRSATCVQAELDAWPDLDTIRSIYIDMARGA